jgi:hypothetical protein
VPHAGIRNVDNLEIYITHNNMKVTQVTAMMEPLTFPALLPTVSVAVAAAAVVVAMGVIVAAGLVAWTSMPETTLVAART